MNMNNAVNRKFVGLLYRGFIFCFDLVASHYDFHTLIINIYKYTFTFAFIFPNEHIHNIGICVYSKIFEFIE